MLETVPEDAQKLMKWKLKTIARVVNYWSMNTDIMGVYGDYYLKRAIIAQAGLGVNLPEDTIYPLNLGDDTGKPLDGTNNYLLHFDKDAIPPVSAFWSVTLYDQQGFQVANPPANRHRTRRTVVLRTDRFAVGDRNGSSLTPDRAVTL